MTPLPPPPTIGRCSASSRSFLLGPDGPAGAPPGQALRSGALIGLREKRVKNKIRHKKVSTLRGEPRSNYSAGEDAHYYGKAFAVPPALKSGNSFVRASHWLLTWTALSP